MDRIQGQGHPFKIPANVFKTKTFLLIFSYFKTHWLRMCNIMEWNDKVFGFSSHHCLQVVYLRERSHVPETAAWPGLAAGPEFSAEMSRGPGPNPREDPRLLHRVEQRGHCITLKTHSSEAIEPDGYLLLPPGRRWRCLHRTWRRSWGCWAPSCSWRDGGSSSSGSWGLLLSPPTLDIWHIKDEERGNKKQGHEAREEKGRGAMICRETLCNIYRLRGGGGLRCFKF